jgi:hypothetical protein
MQPRVVGARDLMVQAEYPEQVEHILVPLSKNISILSCMMFKRDADVCSMPTD